jgi:pyruvate/2-oxoglutarate dehydrogenase complex dihydrolipoamide dehydrogenase (E3) component
LFRDEGIDVLLGTRVLSVNGLSGGHVSLQLQSGNGTRTVEGTDILVAIGRTPNTSGIGLEKAGIEVTDKGHIRVNESPGNNRAERVGDGRVRGQPKLHPRFRGRL